MALRASLIINAYDDMAKLIITAYNDMAKLIITAYDDLKNTNSLRCPTSCSVTKREKFLCPQIFLANDFSLPIVHLLTTPPIIQATLIELFFLQDMFRKIVNSFTFVQMAN
jgi:hypothetical protein